MAPGGSDMANLDESLEKRLTETITRYRENETDRQTHEANLQQTGDWREVESPERLLNRMVALGLRRLAGSPSPGLPELPFP